MNSNLPQSAQASSKMEELSPVEIIRDGDLVLAYIISGQWQPAKTEFVTPDQMNQQIGMIVYGEGSTIAPHVHLPVVREVHGASEVIIVRKGKCVADFYSKDKKYLLSRELSLGDVALLIDGGHGFRMLEDTVLLEVKQGPYIGLKEKERF
jgi:hypothetical protein